MLLKAKPWGSPTIECFTSVCELSIVDMSKGVVNLNWWILSLPNAVKNTFEPSGLKSIRWPLVESYNWWLSLASLFLIQTKSGMPLPSSGRLSCWRALNPDGGVYVNPLPPKLAVNWAFCELA